ncbi:MAG: hypothetical protein CL868_18735 [Cytophagaceae bacterium]|jgi:hypothetical protein|nr:hypothetical protein [Cytophagaceae bacterium]
MGRAIVRNAIRAAMPVPAVEAGNDYTPYATNRGWEWRNGAGFGGVAASQSKMIDHSDLIRLAVFCGIAGIHF